MAYPGVITEHCSIIQPNIGIITNVGLAHIGNFQGDVAQLAAAKSELIVGTKQNGIFFVNADDPNTTLLSTGSFHGKIYTVGIHRKADYEAKQIAFTEEGMSFTCVLSGLEHAFHIPVHGEHNVYNALFAIGVAHQLGFSPEEIKGGLKKAKKPSHRLDIYRLKDGITVIDDTVHAHPPAMKAAIDVLSSLGKEKRIAVLGSMPELGDKIEEYHQEVGQYLATKDIHFLFTYGNISVHIGTGAVSSGFPASRVRHKTPLYRKVLHRELTELIEPGTTILVKGASRLDMFETVAFLCDYYKVD